jgi:BclB C-terminal domain-containing protein
MYKAGSNSNSFTPIGGATVSFAPGFTGLITAGTISTGSATGLNVAVQAGDRLMLVFSSTATGITLMNAVTGYASAGIEIK